MVKSKKATSPIWAATLENVAHKRPDKDQLNNTLSVRKYQYGSSTASQWSRILTYLKIFSSLTILQRPRELEILHLATRIVKYVLFLTGREKPLND